MLRISGFQALSKLIIEKTDSKTKFPNKLLVIKNSHKDKIIA